MPTRILFPEGNPQRREYSRSPTSIRGHFNSAPLPSFLGDHQSTEPTLVDELSLGKRNDVDTCVEGTNAQQQPTHPAANAHRRSIANFRSSILQELRVRSDSDAEQETAVEDAVHLSKDDIRASPRLMGYLFSMIAAAVMLVSVVQFYRQEIGSHIDDSGMNLSSQKYYVTSTALVYQWKLWGAIYVGAVGVGLCLVTVLVHFDTILAPGLWIVLFRDGSLSERNWIIAMIAFWLAGIHICTSTYSVGETQANVFFTTWIAFASMALNYGVWRESAGMQALTDKVNLHHRKTTANWMWTGLFSLIFAGSATDIYYNRDEIEIRYLGEELILDKRDWVIVLVTVWTEVTLCLLAVALNEFFQTSWQLPCSINRREASYRFNFGWRQLEGLIILAAIATKFYFILTYTGVDGVINGLSNAYFGIWGSFFNSVFAFGSWLRENKNMEYITRIPHAM